MGKKSRVLTRRDVLGGAIVMGAAATTVSSVLDAADAPPTPSVRKPATRTVDYDAIVIGGGFAGATAARELGCDGRKVLLIEGRNRLGGRTFTSTFAGQRVEFGGQAVHWLQPHIWNELQRYNKSLELLRPAELDRTFVMPADGTVHRITPQELQSNFSLGHSRFCAHMQELFPRPYEMFFNPEVKRLERVSAAEHIESLGLTAVQKAQMTAFIELWAGGPANEYPYVNFVKLNAGAGWNIDGFMEASEGFGIREGGTLAVVKAMLDHARADVRLSTAVKSIEQQPGKVTVGTDDGVKTTASIVVITVPTNVYSDIEFTPQLSAAKQRFIGIGEMSRGAMLYMRIRQKIRGFYGVCSLPNPFSVIVTYGQDDGTDGTVLMAVLADHAAVDLNSHKALAAALKKVLPEADLVDFSAYDWAADPFCKQSWPAMRIGQLGLVSEMAGPEGRLFFAGASLAKGWNQYIDGAVESGLVAAAQARALLNGKST